MRLVVLGAGFGGLEVATTVAARCGDAVDITLIDQGDGFIFGFSKLDVMFGRITPDHALHSYRDFPIPGVRFVSATVTGIDPKTRRVQTSEGAFDADILVVALGVDLHPEATPGLVEGGHEFYTVAGAFALRDVLAEFEGGHVVVGVTSTPFKCPPAPSETALLVHELLRARAVFATTRRSPWSCRSACRSRRPPRPRPPCCPPSRPPASDGSPITW
jgi:sulfide:quinone oxidoreductase